MDNNYFIENKIAIILFYLIKLQENKDNWWKIDMVVDDNRMHPIIWSSFINNHDLFLCLKYFLDHNIFEDYHIVFKYKDNLSNLDLINNSDLVKVWEYIINITYKDFEKIYSDWLYKYEIALWHLNESEAYNEIKRYYKKWLNWDFYLLNDKLFKKEYQVNTILKKIKNLEKLYDKSKIVIKNKEVYSDSIDLFSVLLYLQNESILNIEGVNFDEKDVYFNLGLLKDIVVKIDDNFSYQKMLDYKEDFNKNGFIFYVWINDFQVRDMIYKFEEIDKNLWAWIYLLYTILKEWWKENIDDYLSLYKKYRKDKFWGRETKTSDLINAKSRLNNFLNIIWAELVKNNENKFEIVLK